MGCHGQRAVARLPDRMIRVDSIHTDRNAQPRHGLQGLATTIIALGLALSVVSPSAGRAQGMMRCAERNRVRSVSFSGSPHFSSATLSMAVVTHGRSPMARLFRRTSPCVDTLELRRDALRVAVLHRQAGWFLATVTPQLVATRNGSTVRFVVSAGAEAVLDSLQVSGLPIATADRPPMDAPLRALVGMRFDRVRADSAIESVVAQLGDHGYARAGRPSTRIVIDSAKARVSLALDFAVGSRLTIDAIRVQIDALKAGRSVVDSAAVMRLIALRPGRLYSATEILEAQRALYRSDAFRLVLIDTLATLTTTNDSNAVRRVTPDSLISLRIAVAEAKTRSARVGLGWATQDCVRAQGRLTNRSFLGVGRRVELNARASKIGVGAPTDFAPAFCSTQVRNDQFSQQLNYYFGSTIASSQLFGRALSPVATLYRERRSEPNVYLRETDIGGVLEVSTQFTRRTSGSSGLQYENGKTIADPAVSCTRFAQCRPEDYVLSFFGRSIGIVSATLAHDRTDDAINPTRGVRARGELRAGLTASQIVSTLRFYRTSGEGTVYARLLGGILATRVQLARAFAPGAQLVDGSPLIPQQERLFAGGQSSVRGFQQNLLGPLVYTVDSVELTRVDGIPVVRVPPGSTDYNRAIPRGGTAQMVANLEFRHAVRGISGDLQLAAFVDVGSVWEAQSDGFRWADVRATPGLGLRLVTPLGPFRVDIGYSPYPPRAGRALYFTKNDGGGTFGQIRCASPGNLVSVDPDDPGDIFDCPSTFRPATPRNILSRLTIHFGLGQAF